MEFKQIMFVVHFYSLYVPFSNHNVQIIYQLHIDMVINDPQSYRCEERVLHAR